MVIDLYIQNVTVSENLQKKIWDLRLSNEFLDLTTKAQSTKGKMDKYDLIKILVLYLDCAGYTNLTYDKKIYSHTYTM